MDIKSSNKKGQDRYFVSLVLSVITPRLRKYFICCLVILGLNCTFGCANIIVNLLPKQDMLMMKARYGEMMHHMERNVENPETAKSYDLYCLCMSYSKVKNYNKLFSCLDYLERRVEKGDHYGPMSWDFRPAGSIYRAEALIDLGDYPKAISAAKKACELSDAIESTYFITAEDLSSKLQFKIPSLAALGLAHALNGDRRQAERAAAELKTIEKLATDSYAATGITKACGIAKIYMALGDYSQALESLTKEWDELEDAIGNLITGDFLFGGQPFYYINLPREFLICKLLLETGDVQTAKKGMDNLLEMPQISTNGEIYWILLFDRGRIAEMEGDNKGAIELYRRAINVTEQQRSSISTEASKIGFVGDKQAVYYHMIKLLFEQDRYTEAFKYVEMAKARALVDMLASRKKFVVSEGDPQGVNDLISSLNKMESETRMQDETVTFEQANNQRGVIVNLKKKLEDAFPELASLVTVNALEVSAIQGLISPDETLIEYYGSNDTLFAFIVTRDQVRGVKLNVEKLNSNIEKFRRYIMLPPNEIRALTVEVKTSVKPGVASNYNQLQATGTSLYQKLIQPLEGILTSNNLIIVPHGALHYLPFNALFRKEGYLIDRYIIRVLPSASVMKFFKTRREGQTGELIAFGNPDLNDPRFDLPYAEAEAIAIAKTQPNSKILIRQKATETMVKKLGGHFRWIHFATHGAFNPDNPLQSGLLLAEDSKNDGILTVGELYDLNLNADLVTLSACETGLGKVANGDDVVGFTRGFLYAGTNSIVSSLWKVDDQATSILMQQFYKSLKERDKRSALRTAQLKVKDTYNSHPYFWAAFQITGSVQ